MLTDDIFTEIGGHRNFYHSSLRLDGRYVAVFTDDNQWRHQYRMLHWLILFPAYQMYKTNRKSPK